MPPVGENAALLTGQEVMHCPACSDEGRVGLFAEFSQPGVEFSDEPDGTIRVVNTYGQVKCFDGHAYTVRSRNRYSDGRETFMLIGRYHPTDGCSAVESETIQKKGSTCQCLIWTSHCPVHDHESEKTMRSVGSYDYKEAQHAMVATLKAGARVREDNGIYEWLRGAPTHVLADLLNELAKDGWHLRKDPS